MEPSVGELLDAADDPVHAEFPPGFDRAALHARVTALAPILERLAGRPFTLDDNAQDASFFGDLTVRQPGALSNHTDTVLAVRFSNFGNLFTTWSHGPEQLPDRVTADVVAAVEAAGFRFIPPALLDQPYTGRHHALRGENWWVRYFDYL